MSNTMRFFLSIGQPLGQIPNTVHVGGQPPGQNVVVIGTGDPNEFFVGRRGGVKKGPAV